MEKLDDESILFLCFLRKEEEMRGIDWRDQEDYK